jgi:hypothetical protein
VKKRTGLKERLRQILRTRLNGEQSGEDNIKMDPVEVSREGVRWIEFSSAQWV